MKKTIFMFFSILILVFITITVNANDTLNSNQELSSKAIQFTKENLDKFKSKLDTKTSVVSSKSKETKKSYEIYGFKDIDEVKKLEVGQCFGVYSIKSNKLNENDGISNSIVPTNFYKVF